MLTKYNFQPPVPVEKWENVYNATEDGAICPQPTDKYTINVVVSEDCLLLNVYSTKVRRYNSLNCIYFIGYI